MVINSFYGFNYTTTVNKKKQSKKLEIKKFCKWCNASVVHKESK